VRKGGEVGDDVGRVAVGEEEAYGSAQVLCQAVDAVGLGLLRVAAQGAGGEFGFAEKETRCEMVVSYCLLLSFRCLPNK
jgi:hypothetical protein